MMVKDAMVTIPDEVLAAAHKSEPEIKRELALTRRVTRKAHHLRSTVIGLSSFRRSVRPEKLD
jgi:hypothetical protein